MNEDDWTELSCSLSELGSEDERREMAARWFDERVSAQRARLDDVLRSIRANTDSTKWRLRSKPVDEALMMIDPRDTVIRRLGGE